jgi:cytochrome P450
LTYAISLQRGNLHNQLTDFHGKHGSIVRIAPNELSFTDPQALKDIYATRSGHSAFERNQIWFKPAKPGNPNSIMGPDEEAHARYRRILVHAFSEKSLKEQAPMIEAHLDQLVEKLREVSNDTAINLVEWINFTTFDIAGNLCFGESFDCLKNGKAHPWVEISYDFGKGVALIAAVNFYPPLDRLLRLVIPKQIMQRTTDHMAMSRAKVMKRLSTDTDRPDFVTHILKQNKENEAKAQSKAMTPAEIGLNMTVLIFAGSETTASGLSGIMRMLVQNKEPLAKLALEVRSSFADEADITLASVGRLEYLDAIINEGMRLCPPVVIGLPRIVPVGGDVICGQFVPAGVSE